MKPLTILLIALSFWLLAGCQAGGGQDPAALAVEQYLEALAAQDAAAAQQVACDELRAFVLDDLGSSAEDLAQVDNVACEVIETADGVARVTCGGTSSILGEPEVIELPAFNRVYVVEQRGDNWLICDLAERTAP
ncbi:MAG TPA: hypothetical protein VFF68_05195 [Anaerolineaceae bacterium]|nr:hypothetical protein [Anaerolineaceae bacterium]